MSQPGIVPLKVNLVSCPFVISQEAAVVDVEKPISEAVSVSVTTSVSPTASAAKTMNLFALPVSLLCSVPV